LAPFAKPAAKVVKEVAANSGKAAGVAGVGAMVASEDADAISPRALEIFKTISASIAKGLARSDPMMGMLKNINPNAEAMLTLGDGMRVRMRGRELIHALEERISKDGLTDDQARTMLVQMREIFRVAKKQPNGLYYSPHAPHPGTIDKLTGKPATGYEIALDEYGVKTFYPAWRGSAGP